MNIGVIGLGYVGLTFSIAAADCGHTVYGIEKNPHIISNLSAKKAHFFEPGLDSLIRIHYDKAFFVVDRFPDNIKFDAFMITVGTPLRSGHSEPDFDYIKSALQTIGQVYSGNELIILRSTVSVGITRKVVLPYLAELSGKSQSDILVSFCPERTVEGKAVEELRSLPQIISGNNEKSIQIAQELFRALTPYVIPVSSLEEAELIKLFNNTYRDMSFALGNVFCMTAQEFGIDGITAIKHANQGYARSSISLPGFVGGPCLEKDAYLLTHNMPESQSKSIILQMRQFNESLEDQIVDWVVKQTDQNRSKPIAITGLTFKGEPETSDLRGSNAINTARKLVQLGFTVKLHDFTADLEEMEALNLGECSKNLTHTVQNTEILLVLNNNKRYLNLDSQALLSESTQSYTVFDLWSVCRNLARDPQIKLINIGNMKINGDLT